MPVVVGDAAGDEVDGELAATTLVVAEVVADGAASVAG